MNNTEQLEFLERNYKNVNIRWVGTRCCYRLALGDFSMPMFLKPQPILGLGEYWTVDASEEGIAIASACRDIKKTLMLFCDVPGTPL